MKNAVCSVRNVLSLSEANNLRILSPESFIVRPALRKICPFGVPRSRGRSLHKLSDCYWFFIVARVRRPRNYCGSSNLCARQSRVSEQAGEFLVVKFDEYFLKEFNDDLSGSLRTCHVEGIRVQYGTGRGRVSTDNLKRLLRFCRLIIDHNKPEAALEKNIVGDSPPPQNTVVKQVYLERPLRKVRHQAAPHAEFGTFRSRYGGLILRHGGKKLPARF